MIGKNTVSASADTTQKDENDVERFIDAVAEDRRLGVDEKETVLRFSKCDERVWISTEERGLMRRLLQHPEFELERLRVITEDSWGTHIDPDDFDGGSITGVGGWLPIGVLSVKTSTRTTAQHSAIVSDRVLRGE